MHCKFGVKRIEGGLLAVNGCESGGSDTCLEINEVIMITLHRNLGVVILTPKCFRTLNFPRVHDAETYVLYFGIIFFFPNTLFYGLNWT